MKTKKTTSVVTVTKILLFHYVPRYVPKLLLFSCPKDSSPGIHGDLRTNISLVISREFFITATKTSEKRKLLQKLQCQHLKDSKMIAHLTLRF